MNNPAIDACEPDTGGSSDANPLDLVYGIVAILCNSAPLVEGGFVDVSRVCVHGKAHVARW